MARRRIALNRCCCTGQAFADCPNCKEGRIATEVSIDISGIHAEVDGQYTLGENTELAIVPECNRYKRLTPTGQLPSWSLELGMSFALSPNPPFDTTRFFTFSVIRGDPMATNSVGIILWWSTPRVVDDLLQCAGQTLNTWEFRTNSTDFPDPIAPSIEVFL